VVAANSGRRTAARPAAMRRGGNPSCWKMFFASTERGGREGRGGGTQLRRRRRFFSVCFCFHFSFTAVAVAKILRRRFVGVYSLEFPFLHSGPVVLAWLHCGFWVSSSPPAPCKIGSTRCKWVSHRQNGSDSYPAEITGLQSFPAGLVMILQWIFEELLG